MDATTEFEQNAEKAPAVVAAAEESKEEEDVPDGLPAIPESVESSLDHEMENPRKRKKSSKVWNSEAIQVALNVIDYFEGKYVPIYCMKMSSGVLLGEFECANRTPRKTVTSGEQASKVWTN